MISTLAEKDVGKDILKDALRMRMEDRIFLYMHTFGQIEGQCNPTDSISHWHWEISNVTNMVLTLSFG